MDSAFSDLGIDSLEKIDILSQLEEESKKEIGDDALSKIKTLGDAVKLFMSWSKNIRKEL